MIKSFQEIGKLQLEGLSDSEKRKKFLETQTIIPNEPKSDNEDANKYREVIINLNTEKDNIEIKLGKELYNGNREEFFGFKISGNSSKTFFTSDNLNYHLVTIPHLIYYIEKENLDFEGAIVFLDWLKKLKNKFYVKNGVDYFGRPKSYLAINKLIKNQKKEIIKFINEDIKKYTKQDKIRELRKFQKDEFVDTNIIDIEKYFKKLITLVISTTQTFLNNNLNIFSLKINNKYITETKYKDQYIKVTNYILQQRFFDISDKMVNKDSLCGTCNEKKIVTGQIDIPTKFYVTSSPYFFENLNKNNAYKSFGICQECYQEVMVGISKVEKDYFGRLFNKLNYYVIPKNINENKDYDRKIEIIKDIFADRPEGDKGHLEKLKNLKRQRDFKMDFLFWRPDQASFIVLDSIDEVSYDDIKSIFRSLRNLNQDTYGYESDYRNYKLYFNDLYWLLFPNYRSHNNPDPKLYRKEMLNLFDSIMKGKDIDYNYLIRKFMTIFNKSYYFNKNNRKELITHPLKMNLMLSWLSQITNLKGGYKVREGSNFTEIEDEDIKEFFKVHYDTYEDNSYRQGLFLLGILMNQVLKEQQKANKSANILDKLSFDGMPVRRVKKFTKDITEILNIYDKYSLNQLLHAQMIDRLQGIENSSLNKDEVVFYILSGLSFGRYLGHKHYNNKKGDEK